MVAQKEFRSDLYYRLNVFPVSLPLLRERRKDIPALVEHFVEIFSQRMRRDIRHIPPETMAAFSSYHWPGNIRELQNVIERAVILAQDGVLPNPLPTSVVSMARFPLPGRIFENSEPPEPMTLRDSETCAYTPCAANERVENRRTKGGRRKAGFEPVNVAVPNEEAWDQTDNFRRLERPE